MAGCWLTPARMSTQSELTRDESGVAGPGRDCGEAGRGRADLRRDCAEPGRDRAQGDRDCAEKDRSQAHLRSPHANVEHTPLYDQQSAWCGVRHLRQNTRFSTVIAVPHT